MSVVTAALAASSFVAPGAWLAFTLLARACETRRTRWALAVLLSPACLALEVVTLAWLGVAFERAVSVLAWVNLPALALPFVRRACLGAAPAPPAGLTLAAFLALIAPIGFFWARDDDYRVHGWHNAMNEAMCYRVAALPAAPEDPDLAGVRLNYGWLGHVQASAIAWRADVAPTRVFPWLNALMLLVTLVFMEASASAFSPRRCASATLCAALVLAGTMVSALAVLALVPLDPTSASLQRLLGDVRLAPILAKFHNFDAMVIGIAGLAALVHFVMASWTPGARGTWLAVPVVLAAIGLSYPILFPFAGIAVAAVLAGSLGRREPEASELDRKRGRLAGACAAAGGVSLAYVRYLGRDSTGSFLTELEALTLLNAVVTMLHVLGPWAWIAWPDLAAGWRARAGPRFRLALALLALVGVALCLQMKSGLQYKVYFVQVAVLAPLLVSRVDGWCARWPRGAPAALFACVLGLSAGTAAWIHRQAPSPRRAQELRLDEAAFVPRTPPDPALGWIELVRERTGDDAVVVAPPSDLPFAALTARSQYCSTHAPGRPILGYSLTNAFLFRNKGYPQATLSERQRTIEACFRAGGESSDFADVTRRLRALGRELALVFPPAGSAYLDWLRAHANGVELGSAGGWIVWSLAP